MLLLALAVAPGIFWLWYFRTRDRLRPEPRSLVARVFVLGGAAAFAAALAELLIFRGLGLPEEDHTLVGVAAAAAVIGVVEEAAKFAAIMFGVYRNAAFDEVLDGIIYAVAASLGFATVENVFYVLDGGLGVGVLRAMLSVPGHAFFGALMGFYLGLAKFAGERERWLLALGFGLAALAHALYDAVLLTQSALALVVIPLVFFLWRRAVVHSRRALTMDNKRAEGGA